MAGEARSSRHVVRLAEQGGRKDLRFAVEADGAERKALADALGIPAVEAVRLAGRLVPEGGRDWRLEGRLEADVVQECVVTLAPVASRIDEPVARRYLAAFVEPEGEEAELSEEDVEPLPAALDLAEVMREALALALPPYPRAPGAALGETVVTAPDAEPLTEERARPFAGLRDALGRKD